MRRRRIHLKNFLVSFAICCAVCCICHNENNMEQSLLDSTTALSSLDLGNSALNDHFLHQNVPQCFNIALEAFLVNFSP